MPYSVKIKNMSQVINQAKRGGPNGPEKNSLSYRSKLDSTRPSKCKQLLNTCVMRMCNGMEEKKLNIPQTHHNHMSNVPKTTRDLDKSNKNVKCSFL